MRKQIRCSDILYREHDVRTFIKDVKYITVHRRDDVVAEHLLVTIVLLDDTTFCRRIRTNSEYLQKELNDYVKEANRLLKVYRNACDS